MKKESLISKIDILNCKKSLDRVIENIDMLYDEFSQKVNNFNCNVAATNPESDANIYKYGNIIFKALLINLGEYDPLKQPFPLLKNDINFLTLKDINLIKEKISISCRPQSKNFGKIEEEAFITYFQNIAEEKTSVYKYKISLQEKVDTCKEVSNKINYYDILKGMCIESAFTEERFEFDTLQLCGENFKKEGYFDKIYYSKIEKILDTFFEKIDEGKEVPYIYNIFSSVCLKADSEDNKINAYNKYFKNNGCLNEEYYPKIEKAIDVMLEKNNNDKELFNKIFSSASDLEQHNLVQNLVEEAKLQTNGEEIINELFNATSSQHTDEL
ncbi:hypothetical protein [Candidatus Jidaibacter acanthamoebae]|nr:hypothetical protein [Candidatus Jidaibacter acanthamoeba]